MKKRGTALLLAALLLGLLTAPTASGAVGTTAAAQTVAAGNHFTAVLRSDGSLWMAGANSMGQLGDGTGGRPHERYDGMDYGDKNVFVKVLDGVVSVETSDTPMVLSKGSAFAIRSDGSLWGWGDNYYGQLGIGLSGGSTARYPSTQFDPGVDQPAPVKIMEDVVCVSAGEYNTFAVTSDGALWGWGYNAWGYFDANRYTVTFPILGMASTAEIQSVPVRLMEGVKAVSVGSGQVYVIKKDNSLWGWGPNVEQELGVATSAPAVQEPVKLMEDVRAVCAARNFAYAIKLDGTLWAWGWNGGFANEYRTYGGVLGIDRPVEYQRTPVQLMTDVVSVSACYQHTLAVRSDGSLWGWGKNDNSELGLGKDRWQQTQSAPVKLMDGVAAAAAGPTHSAALKTDGTLWTWGSRYAGGLGDGLWPMDLTGADDDLFFGHVPANVLSGGKLPAAETPAAEPDAPSAWAQEEVAEAISAGLVPEGLQQNYTGAVTRGEVAELFLRLLEVSTGLSTEELLSEHGAETDPAAFTDTDDPDVLAAHALGLINGVEEGRFDPDGTFTRAQIAAILNRAARVLGVETEGYGHAFTDVSGHWAEPELGWPVHAGILSGVGEGRFDPDGVLTTEQAILMTWRALKALG